MIDIARGQVSAAETAYIELRPMVSDLCSKARVKGSVPRALDSQATSELAALASAAKAERISIADPLADAQRLRAESDGLQREHDALVRSIQSTIRSVDQRRSELHAGQLKATESTIREAALAESLATIDGEISPLLVAADLAIELLDADPVGCADRLSAAAQEYGALRERAGELEMTLQRLAPDRAAAAVSLEHARSHMTESAAELNQRRLVVEEKATARAELLGGEATASHRTRINEARRTARETLAKAREAKSAAAGAFQSASARCEEATPGLEAAKNRRASAEGAFDMACQDIARSPGQVFTLIAADPAVCRALRSRIQEIDRTVNDADAAVLMRREDLERSLEGFDETTDAEVSTAAVATLTTEIGDLHQRTGTLYVSLARDDDARRIAAKPIGGDRNRTGGTCHLAGGR